MKKINYRKVLTLLIWSATICGLCFSFAFVSKSEKEVSVKSLNISVYNNLENQFLNENDVKNFLDERGEKIISEKMAKVSIPELEKVINSHPSVEKAEVAKDMNGEIKIDVYQRTPICRVINLDGESYYIDSRSRLMPLNENFSARVIIASGNITEPYSRRYQYSINEISKNKIFSEVSILDDVYQTAVYIQKDTVLSALIHQIYVNEEKEMELFPAIGNHKIIFGTTKDLEQKFNKLKLFYTQGLNKSDSWKKYSVINLKYKNLVVCTKK